MKHIWIIAINLILISDICRSQYTNLTLPVNFKLGVATSSYQIEGAWNVSGRGESSWDYFVHNYPDQIADGSNADVACNSYYKYKEDIALLKELGFEYYRFSLSWSRILPNGTADQINEAGVEYYMNLIQELIDNDIEPVVTIYHWDHPQVLEELGGWANELMVDYFLDYSRVVFDRFAPYIKLWVTINEPKVMCEQGYKTGSKAPGKVLSFQGAYVCIHNVLKAHASAWHLYDDEYRSTYGGEIGIVSPCRGWIYDDAYNNVSVVEQAFLFDCGWQMHPIFIGDYPEIMKTRIAMISEFEGYESSRLPSFTDEWIAYINGTYDFFGLNHYTSRIPTLDPDEQNGIYTTDSGIVDIVDESWVLSAAPWIYVVPEGFGNLLRLIRDYYNNPKVYILENGVADSGGLNDIDRIEYYNTYLGEVVLAANEDGCDIQRYTVWSLIDNFEWEGGYTMRFGIYDVDFNSDNRTRTAKSSTSWWKETISTRIIQDVPTNDSVTSL